eukprot:EG_transcript_19692
MYMFDRDEEGGVLIPGDVPYYGEVQFTVHYRGATDPPFAWLYIDPRTLSNVCYHHGFECELLVQAGEEYLARITRTSDTDARLTPFETVILPAVTEEEE